MRPALAFPFHDPDGSMFSHLQAILPDLKGHFERAYLCPTPVTLRQKEHMRELEGDDFFTIFHMDVELRIGERFAYLYRRAAETAPPGQPLHLCYLDRLSFALRTTYRDSFLADIDSLTRADPPLIFQRSQHAWETHPQNYRDLENIVTVTGRHLFGRDLDYAWCHLVVSAERLRRIMPFVQSPDLSMVAEMIYYLQDDIRTRAVDWLAWEDPFILSRPADELKRERENSPEETRKRLAYILPMAETLKRLSLDGKRSPGSGDS
jgi:hypothetical protein